MISARSSTSVAYGTAEPPVVGDSIQFLMSGGADAIADAVLRMQGTGWEFRSEAEEVRPGVWSMLVVRPSLPLPRPSD